MRPRIDGGWLVALLAGRLGTNSDPSSLVFGLDRAARDVRRWASTTLRKSARPMSRGSCRHTSSGRLVREVPGIVMGTVPHRVAAEAGDRDADQRESMRAFIEKRRPNFA